MNFMDPGLLLSGGAISMVGLALFLYGKKMESINSLGVGLTMMVFPMFIQSVLWMWLIGAACIVALFILSRSS